MRLDNVLPTAHLHRSRVQELLSSREYKQFNEPVLLESAFSQVTRRGCGVRQVQIAVTPNKFIIVAELPPKSITGISENDDELLSFEDYLDSLELVSIVPINCVNISVFSRRRHKLKVHFCNGCVYYFELSERGSISSYIISSLWRQWTERISYLCPEPVSTTSQTSVAMSNSSVSTETASFRKHACHSYLCNRKKAVNKVEERMGEKFRKCCNIDMSKGNFRTKKVLCSNDVGNGDSNIVDCKLNECLSIEGKGSPVLMSSWFDSQAIKRQSVCVNRFGEGVVENCGFNLFLPTGSTVDFSANKCNDNSNSDGTRNRITAKTCFLSNILYVCPAPVLQCGLVFRCNFLDKVNRMRRYTSCISIFKASHSECKTDLFVEEFKLPICGADLCSSVSLDNLSFSPVYGAKNLHLRTNFWTVRGNDKFSTEKEVYDFRLSHLNKIRDYHSKTSVHVEKTGNFTSGVVMSNGDNTKVTAMDVLKRTYRNMFSSLISNRKKRRRNIEPVSMKKGGVSSIRSRYAFHCKRKLRSVSYSPVSTSLCSRKTDNPCDGRLRRSVSESQAFILKNAEIEDSGNVICSETAEVCLAGRPSKDNTIGSSVTNSQSFFKGILADQPELVYRRFRNIDSLLLAQQMTFIDVEMFSKFNVDYLLKRTSTSLSRHTHIISSIVLYYFRVVCLLTTEILLGNTYRERARLIAKVITLAERCYSIYSFHSCKAVLTSLQSIPVYRLSATWDYVRAKHSSKYRSFKKLSKLFSNTRCARHQRFFWNVLRSGRCNVPFFGFIVDVLFQNNDVLQGKARKNFFNMVELLRNTSRNVYLDRERCGGGGSGFGGRKLVISYVPAMKKLRMWLCKRMKIMPFLRRNDAMFIRRSILEHKYFYRWLNKVKSLRCLQNSISYICSDTATINSDVADLLHSSFEKQAFNGRVLHNDSLLCEFWSICVKRMGGYDFTKVSELNDYLLQAEHYTMEECFLISQQCEPDDNTCTLCESSRLSDTTNSNSGNVE